MQKTDRIILLFFNNRNMGGIGTLWFRPYIVNAGDMKNTHDYATEEHKHNTSDISKFKWKIRRIVEDCSVTEGEILC
jgi:hypothetical protein